MKAAIIFLAAVVGLWAQGADEAVVKGVVARYVAARDASDAKALQALFTAGVDQLVSSGEWRRGREEVVKGTLASSAREAGKRTIDVDWVRFVKNDVAIAEGRYQIGERGMWTSILLTREAGEWKIAAIRNMLPAGR